MKKMREIWAVRKFGQIRSSKHYKKLLRRVTKGLKHWEKMVGQFS